MRKCLRAEPWSFALDCTDMKQCFMVAKSQTYLNARDRGREGGRSQRANRNDGGGGGECHRNAKGEPTELRHKKVCSLRLSRHVIMSCLVAISTIACLPNLQLNRLLLHHPRSFRPLAPVAARVDPGSSTRFACTIHKFQSPGRAQLMGYKITQPIPPNDSKLGKYLSLLFSLTELFLASPFAPRLSFLP